MRTGQTLCKLATFNKLSITYCPTIEKQWHFNMHGAVIMSNTCQYVELSISSSVFMYMYMYTHNSILGLCHVQMLYTNYKCYK